MPQLHFYVPESIATQIKDKAKHAHLPVSKYVALLVKKAVRNEWPTGYFDVFGSFKDDPLQRPEQGDLETREVL